MRSRHRWCSWRRRRQRSAASCPPAPRITSLCNSTWRWSASTGREATRNDRSGLRASHGPAAAAVHRRPCRGADSARSVVVDPPSLLAPSRRGHPRDPDHSAVQLAVMMQTIIRASYLSAYPDCPRRVAANVFADDIRAAGFKLRELVQNVGAAIGTSVHRGAAAILSEKARIGRMPAPDLGLDAARDTMRELASQGIAYDAMSSKLAAAETAALRMTAAYRDELAPWIEPILIEERLEARAGTGHVL